MSAPESMTIPTACGDVPLDRLGATLVHEHVFLTSSEFTDNYGGDFDEDAVVDAAARELTALHALGIGTIFDPTVYGLGRNIARIVRVAERTPLNIVVATGMYTFRDVPKPFAHVGPGLWADHEEILPSLFLRDIEKGIGDTGVRAAFLKCAIDAPGLTPGVERIMRSVGQVSAQTGTPVTVHTSSAARTGLIAQDVLAAEGVDLARVVIGHAGSGTDLDYLQALADRGSLLGMDQFGMDISVTTGERIATIKALVDRGYVASLVLSHDASCHSDLRSIPGLELPALANNRMSYLSQEVLPAMREAGITDADITTMLVDNPRRFLGG